MIEGTEQHIQHLEQRLDYTERRVGRLVDVIAEQLEQEGKAVPAWLLPLLKSPVGVPIVPRVDVVSGHTIGRTIYSPMSQRPKQLLSSQLLKFDDDDMVDRQSLKSIQ